MLRKTYLSLLIVAMGWATFAQKPVKPSSADIYQDLQKLNVLGSVLYVAAHPDDENTSLISYYANEKLFRTAYLSATRGDGGQNLIGPEIREQLGIIRTQELLAARRTDGGRQFFTRANDFGYSKHSEETFNIWDREKVLADFVWAIRNFRPDVIITRFNTQPGITHGHHTASAILAKEAFKLSGSKDAFPEQLKYVDTWQPKRLYWNTSWWFYRRSGEEFDTTGLASVNVGEFNPVLGKSYTEISSLSRSMHKSQGFGSTGSRGDDWEYLVQWDGSESQQPFKGIDTSWTRIEGGDKVKPIAQKLVDTYDPAHPARSYENLLRLKAAIQEHVQDQFWKQLKLQEVNDLLLAVTGTYLEVTADDYAYVPGDSIELSLEAINRSYADIALSSIEIQPFAFKPTITEKLYNNKPVEKSWQLKLPDDLAYTQPYWLEQDGTLGMYRVDDQRLIGKPENDPPLYADVTLTFLSEQYQNSETNQVQTRLPVVFKRNDPVDGETYRPLAIQPRVMVNLGSSALFFSNNDPKTISARVIAGSDKIKGTLSMEVPDGWRSEPATIHISLDNKGEEKLVDFSIYPPGKASQGEVKPVFSVNGKSYSKGRAVIDYDHIPAQILFPQSTARIARLDIETRGNLIGYIMGAGDDMPASLEQISYDVELLEKDDVVAGQLAKYDAVIVGIRAFNTVDWLSYKNQELFDYAQQGGTVIVQYNTSYRMITSEVAPYDLQMSRDRVTVEEAEVRILAPDHPVINEPNKITQKDFEGWVQERGLYFPNAWSDEFTPILSSNDPGESPKNGGLLVAKHGQGYYIYTGYSWFRELPAGVPGAYRLFANLISIGK